jgi:hypothetical protein
MRYLRQRLERIPTLFLMVYVVLADLVMVLGIVPFELYCRAALVQHRNDVGFLLEILAANAVLVVFLLSAMAIASLALGRGVLFAVRTLKIKT